MLVSEFLSQLKVRARIQANQTVLTDSDLIDFANSEMRMVICPKILSVREDYFAGLYDYPLVAGKRRYRLPRRNLGQRVLRVFAINNDVAYPLPQRSPTESYESWTDGFYMSEGDIVLVGNQLPTGTLRIVFPIRPPKMSATAVQAGVVTSAGASSITASNSLTGDYEVIRGGSPYRTISYGMNFSSGIGTDSFCSTAYDRFMTGDIVISLDSTHIVPLEDELCDWLIQRSSMRVLEYLGHTEELAAAGAKLGDMEADYLALINPRVADEPKTVSGMEISGWRGW